MKNTIPDIKKVIYSYPKTIILWADNTKTIVSLKGGEKALRHYQPYQEDDREKSRRK